MVIKTGLDIADKIIIYLQFHYKTKPSVNLCCIIYPLQFFEYLL
jgi:hypothetical protein